MALELRLDLPRQLALRVDLPRLLELAVLLDVLAVQRHLLVLLRPRDAEQVLPRLGAQIVRDAVGRELAQLLHVDERLRLEHLGDVALGRGDGAVVAPHLRGDG